MSITIQYRHEGSVGTYSQSCGFFLLYVGLLSANLFMMPILDETPSQAKPSSLVQY